VLDSLTHYLESNHIMHSKDNDFHTRRERENKRLQELRDKRPKDEKEFQFTGVLLSDAIKKCCDSFDLITPLKEDNLKPANYKLRIGDEYATGGQIHLLSDKPGQSEIRIEPFEVAIIKTLETINMPRFLIGRWNIQVSKAYKGLLWVGGPQVDAGYVGHLFCPIYNLSDKAVILHYGDPIAVIDFERTTHFHEGVSKDYKGSDRVLIQDYEPENLQSALATQAQNTIKAFGSRLESLSTRIDFFVTITFALLGILFAAGTLFVTESGHSHWWDPSIFWICVIAIVFSGWALVRSHPTTVSPSRTLQVILTIIFLVLLGIGLTRQEHLQNQIDELRGQVQRQPRGNIQPSPENPK
jgi:deoxycytidine triphosphate deaminase